jgi:hypothetical protein
MLLFALACSSLLLFMLAGALHRSMPPLRAALIAFGISAVLHGTTTLLMHAQARLSIPLFRRIPT